MYNAAPASPGFGQVRENFPFGDIGIESPEIVSGIVQAEFADVTASHVNILPVGRHHRMVVRIRQVGHFNV